jgi:hypothetical protein
MSKHVGALLSWELLDCYTVLGYSPQSFRHWRWVEQVFLRIGSSQGVCSFLGMVMGHCSAQVVRHVGAPDVVVQEVDQITVGAVNGLEGAFHPGVVVFVEVSNVHV